MQQHHLVAVAGGQVEVVQDHDGGDAECAHELQHLVLVPDVEVVGGFVEQQVVGALCQRTRDEHPLLLAAGQPGDDAVGEVPGTHLRQSCGRELVIRDRVALERPKVGRSSQQDRLGHRQRDVGVLVLGDDGEAARLLPRGERGEVGAVEAHQPGSRGEGGVERAQQRGLATAVRADQPDDESGTGRHADRVEHERAVVGEGDVVCGDHDSPPNLS